MADLAHIHGICPAKLKNKEGTYMFIHCYTIYDEEWPDNPDRFWRVIEKISERLRVENYKIGYLETYNNPIRYHKDQVLTKEELREFLNCVWTDKYWGYIVAYKFYFCMHEDNICIGCSLSRREISEIAKEYNLCTQDYRISDNRIEKYCFWQSLITPKRIKIKEINKPPLEGYGATPILLPESAIKEYDLDKSPFGTLDDWSHYEDIGETFGENVLTEKMYFDKVERMINFMREITDCLKLTSFRLVQCEVSDCDAFPVTNLKKITQNEMLEIVKWALINNREFAIKSEKFLIYFKLGFRFGINTTLPYDKMDQIAKKYGVYSTVMWKEKKFKYDY